MRYIFKKEIDFIDIAQQTVSEIISTIEKNFSDDIEIEIIDDGLVNFYNDDGKYCVLNINRIRREIWFASPINGPSHYMYNNANQWIDLRNNSNILHDIILQEIKLLINHCSG